MRSKTYTSNNWFKSLIHSVNSILWLQSKTLLSNITQSLQRVLKMVLIWFTSTFILDSSFCCMFRLHNLASCMLFCSCCLHPAVPAFSNQTLQKLAFHCRFSSFYPDFKLTLEASSSWSWIVAKLSHRWKYMNLNITTIFSSTLKIVQNKVVLLFHLELD